MTIKANLHKKTVIITGASRGIGAKMAEIFALADYNVVINYNQSESAALKLVQELSFKNCIVKAIKADVTNRAQVEQMVQMTLEYFGDIDVLINNAGIANYQMFTDLSGDEWDKLMAVNVKGTFICSQVVLKTMLPNKCGTILNMSSIWGITGASCEVAYSASKAAVIGLTKALAKELAPSGITVNCLAPGVINTDMMSDFCADEIEYLKSQIPLNRFGAIEDIAKTALFLASESNAYMTGQVISPNGGMVI